MYHKQSWRLIGFFFISLIFLSNICWGQESQQAQDKRLEKRLTKVSSATKLDVHRFMGYENLLPKYISLPYDVSMNTNVKGPLFDVGYLLLLFIPILLLFSIRKNVFRILLMLIFLAVYCVSSITGYCAAKRIVQSELQETTAQELVVLNNESDYLGILKLTLFQITTSIGQPLLDAIHSISGKGDIVTYPFLFFLFILLTCFFLREHKFLNYKKWFLFFFALAYLFFLWVLSAGIVYYGMLFFPIGFLLITLVYKNLKDSNKLIHIAFISLTIAWIIGSTAYRLANFYPKTMANRMIHPACMNYGLGKANKAQATNMAYINFSTVLEKLNSDPTVRIYKAGTFFHYFVNSNDIRILEDNQLDKISRLQRKYIYQGNEEVIKAFKRSGYKYLLIDLHLPNVDNSPGRDFMKKVEKLNMLLGSPSIRLIGTDRVMENNTGQSVYSIYGKKIIGQGSFAAFEII